MVVESHRLKMTPQRRAIIEYLQSAIHHPTAEEVLRAVNEKFPMTSRATVYNTLNWLKGEGMVREVYEGGIVRFDPNTSDHHHFVCRICGRVEDVESEMIGSYQFNPSLGNHTVENFEIILRGICSDCRSN
jgi:Fur family transcriptional regulator, peroxide stress response regulator